MGHPKTTAKNLANLLRIISFFMPMVKHFASRQRLQNDRESTATVHLPSHRPLITCKIFFKMLKNECTRVKAYLCCEHIHVFYAVPVNTASLFL